MRPQHDAKRKLLEQQEHLIREKNDVDGQLCFWPNTSIARCCPPAPRFLFCELVQRGIVPKHSINKRRADQDTIDALKSLRDDASVPWNSIVDETRSLSDFTGDKSVKEGLEAMLEIVELDPWQGDVPLILCESRSLAGVLRSPCSEYRGMIAATNGQVGGFLHTVIGPKLKELAKICYPRIGYLGDLDLAGGDIEKNTKRVLEQIVGEELVNWQRLALTQAQVEQYEWPVIIKHDRRFADGGAHEAVEPEALSQAVIVEIVRDWLEELLPEPLQTVLEREEQEREALKQYLSNYR
jgi:hypothetical protein